MNKLDLAAKLAEDIGVTKVTAVAAIESVFESVITALAKGDTVTVIGFGTFKCVDRVARTGRNPRTGGVMQVGTGRTARFTPGKTLKKAINAKR